MKKVLVLIVSMLVCCSGAYAKYCPDLACVYEATQQDKLEYERKYGEKFVDNRPAPNTGSEHVEYDIIHKDGTKEHCYQTMDVFPIQCH